MSCKVIVTQDHEGRRLDRTVRSIWPALPLSAIMRALRKGEVRLDAARVREAGTRLRAGQELYVPWEEPGTNTRGALRPRGVVPVLWKGENAAVLDKPADLLVQPDVKEGDSVITRVWGMFGTGGLGFAPTAVHRLDRNTSGALIVALSGEALRELERLFKERLVMKRYLAVVTGRLPQKGTIDVPLLKDEVNNIVRAGGGKTALSRYERLDALPGGAVVDGESFLQGGPFAKGELSLASIELLTGRTHQARVHMAYIGHPVLGDRKYGDIEANRRWREKVKRPLLHSFELGFPPDVPAALRELAGKIFRAPLPDDIAGFYKFQNSVL